MSGLLAELGLQERLGALHRPRVQPRQQAQGEHVLRPLLLLAGQVRERRQRLDRDRGQRHRVHVVALQRAVLERVRGIPHLGEVALGELVGVDDDRGAARQVARGWPSARRGSSRRARRARRPASARRGRRSAAGSSTRRAACPAGARISAGKFGSVDRSLPNRAVCEVNRSPVSCMPSPESPAKRMTTRSSFWTSLVLMLCDVLCVSLDIGRGLSRGAITHASSRDIQVCAGCH